MAMGLDSQGVISYLAGTVLSSCPEGQGGSDGEEDIQPGSSV